MVSPVTICFKLFVRCATLAPVVAECVVRRKLLSEIISQDEVRLGRVGSADSVNPQSIVRHKIANENSFIGALFP